MRKIPMRTCVVSHEKLPKKELIRVVRTENGVIVDTTGKVNGRGAYLKIDKEIFEKAKKNKILERTLETVIDESVYEEISRIINK